MRKLILLLLNFSILYSVAQTTDQIVRTLKIEDTVRVNGLYIIESLGTNREVEKKDGILYFQTDDSKVLKSFLPIKCKAAKSMKILANKMQTIDSLNYFANHMDYELLFYLNDGDSILRSGNFEVIDRLLSNKSFVEINFRKYKMLYIEACWIKYKYPRKYSYLVSSSIYQKILESERDFIYVYYPIKLLKYKFIDY